MGDDRKIVWILGAGFSKFLGAPLLNELLTPQSAERVATIYGSRMDMHMELGAAGVRRVPLLYGAGLDEQWKNPEEFLERLDLALEQESARAILDAWVVRIRESVPGLEWAEPHKLQQYRNDVARVLAAECCLFLKDADTNLERWSPYHAWVQSLGKADVIITFNFDRVLETLGILVPIPNELHDPDLANRPIALKMHGSVDWLLDDGRIRRADGSGVEADRVNDAALFCDAEQIALATPGPRKYRMTNGQNGEPGPLSGIWKRAAEAIAAAEAVVLVGYRLPETDAYSKQWFIDALRTRAVSFRRQTRGRFALPVHTVLGAGLDHPHAKRIGGILREAHRWIRHRPWDMGAEDFLGLVSREDLLAAAEMVK